MRNIKTFIISALLVLTAPLAASATSLTVSNSVAVQSTNFQEEISVSQFDASLGTLTEVIVSLTGTVQGDANAESLDASATTVELILGAEIELTRPDGSVLAVALPTVSETNDLSAFDGAIDFAGASGIALTGLTNTASDTQTLTSASDLAFFTGTGTVLLGVEALAASTGSGSGNLITQFLTSAGATIDITYTFDQAAAVPEPASMLLLGAGLLGASRRRKNKLQA